MGLLDRGNRPLQLELTSPAANYVEAVLRGVTGLNNEPLFATLSFAYNVDGTTQTDLFVRFQERQAHIEPERVLRELEELQEAVRGDLGDRIIKDEQKPNLNLNTGAIRYGILYLPQNTRVILLPSSEAFLPDIYSNAQRPGSEGYRRMVEGTSSKAIRRYLAIQQL